MPFICPQCGKSHEGELRDVAFALPDAIWALGPEERQRHLDWSPDVAYFEGRWFMRGILRIPLVFEESHLTWGVWAVVEESTMGVYRKIFSSDGSDLPPENGSLANTIPGYPKTLGLGVKIQFGTATQRPLFSVEPTGVHPLGFEQQTGISCARLSELIAAYG